MGPVFLDGDRFLWLKGTRVRGAQEFLAFYFNSSLDRVNAGETVVSRAFAGIAAFPSLHVAHMAIMLWIAIRTIPAYAVWMGWVTLTTTLATIGFGWHWVVDAPGGAILGIAVTEALYRMMRRFDKHRERTLAAIAEQAPDGSPAPAQSGG
jgi:membrane-associated phospholipid phosphatase